MLKKILSGKICAECKICCEFDDDDVWDAPCFTKGEFDQCRIAELYAYEKRGDLYCLTMTKDGDGLYHCPCLTEIGCALGDEKPFSCKIWPLYVYQTKNGLGLAVSDVCQHVYALKDAEILDGIRDFIPEILTAIRQNPSLVDTLPDNYRLLHCPEEWGMNDKMD